VVNPDEGYCASKGKTIRFGRCRLSAARRVRRDAPSSDAMADMLIGSTAVLLGKSRTTPQSFSFVLIEQSHHADRSAS